MPTQRCTVRELRTNLKKHIDSTEATTVGNYYDLRAVVVPIPRHDRWNKKERVAALKKARQLFEAALAADK